MKNFKLVHEEVLPSGSVYVLYNEKKNFYVECTSMQDVNTKNKSLEVLTTKDTATIKSNLVPIEDKWLMAISTQYGCPERCKFCLVPSLPFKGNLSYEDMWEELDFIIGQRPEVTKCSKVKVGFARMGEPQFNWKNILHVMKDMKDHKEGFTFLPCYNTILPKVNIDGCGPLETFKHVMEVKEYLNGFMHVQLSINSTNEDQRKVLFGGVDVVTLDEIKKNFNNLKNSNRLITLNFICGKDWEVDPEVLQDLNPEIFCVKLTPLNINPATKEHKLQDSIKWSWDNMNSIKEKLIGYGVPTIVDIAAMCELDLCCGNLVQQKYFDIESRDHLILKQKEVIEQL